MQADLFADCAQRQPFLLSLGEGFAPRLLSRVGFALELLLSGADGLRALGFSWGIAETLLGA